jgi:hypothetical protein
VLLVSHGRRAKLLELRRSGDFGHHFQIQGHGEGDEWMGKLFLSSPRARAARRGRSTRATFSAQEQRREVGGSGGCAARQGREEEVAGEVQGAAGSGSSLYL